MLSALVSPVILMGILVALSKAKWRTHGKGAGMAGGLLACFLLGICLLIAWLTENEHLDPRVLAGAGGAGLTIGALGYVFWHLVRQRFSRGIHARSINRLPAPLTLREIERSRRPAQSSRSADRNRF
jgi:hypothetical protein